MIEGGCGGSPYSEGGALYAFSLIHANHGEGIKQFLRDSLRSTTVEVIQHGACLGLGLASLGTADEDIYEEIKNVLYTDSVVAGEAVGISMGLLMVGPGGDKANEILTYAHETQHEKIIRGLAMEISLTVYRREEEAGTLIEQMTRDQDPILRYGGMYALALEDNLEVVWLFWRSKNIAVQPLIQPLLAALLARSPDCDVTGIT
ncbi:unnamed protein product [Lathyrus sativus]|nr:unnamed protein product [Lathyrus sativus]